MPTAAYTSIDRKSHHLAVHVPGMSCARNASLEESLDAGGAYAKLGKVCLHVCSQTLAWPRSGTAQVVEETVADDDVVMVRGAANTRAVSVLLRGANDYMLDEMDRSLHDAFCIVKRVLESGVVVPGAAQKPSEGLSLRTAAAKLR